MMNRCQRNRRMFAAVLSALLLAGAGGCTLPTAPTETEVAAGVARFVDGFGRSFLLSLATSLIRI